MKPAPRTQKRGAVRHESSVVVSVWLPRDMLTQVDRAVAVQDTDRSKFMRRAIRNALKP